MDHFVIHRPKSVKIEHLLIPGGNGLHFHIRLISNTVINKIKLNWSHYLVKLFLKMMRLKAREERTIVVDSLNECVNSVTIGLDTCYDD